MAAQRRGDRRRNVERRFSVAVVALTTSGADTHAIGDVFEIGGPEPVAARVDHRPEHRRGDLVVGVGELFDGDVDDAGRQPAPSGVDEHDAAPTPSSTTGAQSAAQTASGTSAPAA